MWEEWRAVLYYPLGTLPSLFFFARIVIQWWQSEKHQQSYVSPIFWRLSLIGSVFCTCHYFVQVQYPFAILQAVNAVISWRNLNLIFRKKPPYSTSVAVTALFFCIAIVTLCFAVQSYWVIGEFDWIRSPTKFFEGEREHHAIAWHLIGTFGVTLFASRFWVQWWQAEQNKRSELSRAFWWLSILGAAISTLYFIRVQDTISALMYSVGLVPYVRNLFLIRQSKLST